LQPLVQFLCKRGFINDALIFGLRSTRIAHYARQTYKLYDDELEKDISLIMLRLDSMIAGWVCDWWLW